MPRGGEWEEDEWWAEGVQQPPRYGYIRPPRPPPVEFLAPGGARFDAGGRVRARSFGQQPAPNVYVYTSQHNDNEHEQAGAAAPIGGRGRAGRRDEGLDRVEDRLEDMERELRRGNRSRSRHNEWREPSPMYRPDMQMIMAEREREERRVLEQKLIDLERAREIDRERDFDRIQATQRKLQKLEEERIREGEDRNRFEREEELMKKKAELRRLKDKIEREEEEAKLKAKDAEWKKQLELERLKDEEKRKAAALRAKEERERILLEKEKEERELKAERKRIQIEIEKKEEEEEEERKAVVAAYQAKQDAKKKAEAEAAAKAIADFEKKKADEKLKEEALRAKFKAEDEAKAKKAKEEAEMWKMKLQLEEEKEKEKKKAAEAKLEEEMTKKLSQFGFQNNQIQAMIHPKKAENLPAGALPNRPAVGLLTGTPAAPTFIKVHRDHIDIKTLEYFQLPWEYDSHDRHYIIILQEMDERETDVLFEHTRKLRVKTTMAIEDRGRDRHGNAEYAFVRRRKPSASPNRKRSKSARRFSAVLL